MNHPVALRIVQPSGTVDFYADEIPDADLHYLRHYQVQNNELTQPAMRSEGEAWAVLQVTILEVNGATRTKILALWNDEDEKIVYYAMSHNPLKCITAFLLPEHIEFRRYSGAVLAEHGHKLTFLECE